MTVDYGAWPADGSASSDLGRGVPWRDPVKHRPVETAGERIAAGLGDVGFGAERGADWFECLTDEPDFAAMTGLAHGIRWSDVLGAIEADQRAREEAACCPICERASVLEDQELSSTGIRFRWGCGGCGIQHYTCTSRFSTGGVL